MFPFSRCSCDSSLDPVSCCDVAKNVSRVILDRLGCALRDFSFGAIDEEVNGYSVPSNSDELEFGALYNSFEVSITRSMNGASADSSFLVDGCREVVDTLRFICVRFVVPEFPDDVLSRVAKLSELLFERFDANDTF